MALLRRLTRQLLVGDLLLQRLAFAQLLRQLCLESGVALVGSLRRGDPFGGCTVFGIPERGIRVGQSAFEGRPDSRRLGQLRLSSFELPEGGRGFRRAGFQRAFERRDTLVQPLRELVSRARHLRQAGCELGFTPHEIFRSGRCLGCPPAFRIVPSGFRLRQLLLQRLARGRGFVQSRFVLDLALGQVRRRRRQLRRVPSFRFMTRHLGVGELLLDGLTLGRFVGDACLELRSDFRGLLFGGLALRRCALLDGLKGGF